MVNTKEVNPILWAPSTRDLEHSRITQFAKRTGAPTSYQELHQWSVEDPARFWSSLWDFYQPLGQKGEHILTWQRGDDFYLAHWFKQARLNYAENILRWRGKQEALVYVTEDGNCHALSRDALREQVFACAKALRAQGVRKGDKVAGVLTNCPHAVVCMLATAWLGAVWSSCSPDFGLGGLVDRLGQVQPKILFIPGGYLYKGRRYDLNARIAELKDKLPATMQIVKLPLASQGDEELVEPTNTEDTELSWRDFLRSGVSLPQIQAEQVAFNHPLFVMFSSGTTGLPKCIIHGHGGVLLKHLCEHGFHTNLDEADALAYFTTCGWMMWNWKVSGLLFGARLVLYDAHPFYPMADRLVQFWQEERVTVAGVSAGLLDQMQKNGVRARGLTDLRMICSTGSPLSPDGFNYVYARLKKDVHLASISGGTDLLGCFVLGVPTLPVRRGEIQAAALGVDVAIYDDQGRRTIGHKGELVCCQPFPSIPVSLGFTDPEYAKYKKAYFARFAGVWAHGDYAEQTPDGGFVIYGRSDATLNPGGVRIGSAEIYRPLEQLAEVADCLAVDQEWEGSTRIVLFVVLSDGVVLDDVLRRKICDHLRRHASPRHVPAKIIAMMDLPRTLNGKLCELAVRDTIHGRRATNLTALANPQSLAAFENIKELNLA